MSVAFSTGRGEPASAAARPPEAIEAGAGGGLGREAGLTDEELAMQQIEAEEAEDARRRASPGHGLELHASIRGCEAGEPVLHLELWNETDGVLSVPMTWAPQSHWLSLEAVGEKGKRCPMIGPEYKLMYTDATAQLPPRAFVGREVQLSNWFPRDCVVHADLAVTWGRPPTPAQWSPGVITATVHVCGSADRKPGASTPSGVGHDAR